MTVVDFALVRIGVDVVPSLPGVELKPRFGVAPLRPGVTPPPRLGVLTEFARANCLGVLGELKPSARVDWDRLIPLIGVRGSGVGCSCNARVPLGGVRLSPRALSKPPSLDPLLPRENELDALSNSGRLDAVPLWMKSPTTVLDGAFLGRGLAEDTFPLGVPEDTPFRVGVAEDTPFRLGVAEDTPPLVGVAEDTFRFGFCGFVGGVYCVKECAGFASFSFRLFTAPNMPLFFTLLGWLAALSSTAYVMGKRSSSDYVCISFDLVPSFTDFKFSLVFHKW